MIMLTTTTLVLAHPASGSLQEKVDAYITELMRRFPIPGLAVGIVKGDQILYLKGYGLANTGGDSVTPQTPFSLQSVTKTFTALAIHQLVNAGKINLNEPVQTYIPEFRLADQEIAASITIRQLLEHTSGISQTEGEEAYLQSPKATFAEALHKLANYQPEYRPDEHYEYSNWNYALLGEVITRASGQPYSDYVQQHILDPLEMTRAGFADNLPGAAMGNLIVFGIPVPYKEKYLPAMLGADNLSASAEELTHYLIAYLNEGQYLNHNLLNTQAQGWYDITWNWHKGTPSTSVSNSFSGSHNATQANITIFPASKLGVVVLMNARLEQLIPGPGAWDIAGDIANITVDAPYEVPSNLGFYLGYTLLDGLLLLLIVSIFWQAFRLKSWAIQYKNTSRSKQIAAWLVIIFDLLICMAILILPKAANSSWSVILFHRPDFAIPLLVISLSLGSIGLIKIITTRVKINIGAS